MRRDPHHNLGGGDGWRSFSIEHQRRSNRKFAQLVSCGKLAWNSFRDRALATQSSRRAPAARRGYLTTYSGTWDNGISLQRPGLAPFWVGDGGRGAAAAAAGDNLL
jgi:hypothetical protein